MRGPGYSTSKSVFRPGAVVHFAVANVASRLCAADQVRQLNGAGGAEHWPGCTHVTSKSYKDCLAFDPEAQLPAIQGKFPPALIVHGTANTLHMPEESVRLHKVYPGPKGDAALLIKDMQHGQQLTADNPLFLHMIDNIDRSVRASLA